MCVCVRVRVCVTYVCDLTNEMSFCDYVLKPPSILAFTACFINQCAATLCIPTEYVTNFAALELVEPIAQYFSIPAEISSDSAEKIMRVRLALCAPDFLCFYYFFFLLLFGFVFLCLLFRVHLTVMSCSSPNPCLPISHQLQPTPSSNSIMF